MSFYLGEKLIPGIQVGVAEGGGSGSGVSSADELQMVLGSAKSASDASPSSQYINNTYQYYWNVNTTVSVTIPEGAKLFGLYLIEQKYTAYSGSYVQYGVPYAAPNIRMVTGSTVDNLTFTCSVSNYYGGATSSSEIYGIYVRGQLMALYTMSS